MKVTNLVVEGFKRIVAVNIDLNEHVTELTGANEQGKSSTIDALWTLIDGKKVAPEEIIRRGAERCVIKGRLGELTVTRIFGRTKKGELTQSLTIESADEAYPPTETQLRDLIGEHMLDPGDFIKLKPAEKFDALRMFVPEVDFKKIANEDRADFQRRTTLNGTAKDARAAAAMILVAADVPEEAIDEQALIDELQEAGKLNTKIEHITAARRELLKEIRTDEELIAQVPKRKEDLESEIFHIRDRDLSAINEQRVRLREALRELDEREERLNATCEASLIEGKRKILAWEVEAKARVEMTRQELDKPDMQAPEWVDTQAIAQKIIKAREVNKQITRAAERAKHVAVAVQCEAEALALTEKMKARQKAKEAAIAAANLPIPGLSFGDGEVFLDGLPFEQASTARKMRVGVAVAVARNPKLRLVWIRDASLFDDRSYKLVAELAREFDCQILLETVRPIGKDVIVIENGMVKSKDKGVQGELLTEDN